VTIDPDRLRRYAGTPREIGLAAGRALGPRLGVGIDRYISERPQEPGDLDLEALREGAMPWLRGLPARFQEELVGLAEGSGLPLQRVAEWAYVDSCVVDGCTGFAGRLDGHAWVARNNDMFIPGIWGYATIRDITGRIPTLTFGLEGDVFTATGINRERLWLHQQALRAPDVPRPGRPHLPNWVVMTDLLETCATIAEVEARLDEVDRDEGMLLFAIDGKTDEITILECGSARHVRRAVPGPWLAAANHACVLEEPEPDRGSLARQARVEAMAGNLYGREPGARLPDDLVAILADEGVERRGPSVWTVYGTVACPATGTVWFTAGGDPAASRGDWQRIPWPW
jgi:hypothetical protein